VNNPTATTAVTPPASRRKIARAEPVGSLLRPPEVSNALEAVYGDSVCAWRPSVLHEKSDELRAWTAAADPVVVDAVQRQLDAGLDVVTDGEMRRVTFLGSFYDSADGLGAPDKRFEQTDDEGNVIYEGYADPVVERRVRKAYSPLAEETVFLRSLGDVPFKVTLPAPSYFYSHFVPIEGSGYKNREEFVADAIAIEKEMVAEAIAEGANRIQFDFPLYPGLVDADYTDGLLKEVGGTRESLVDRAIQADSAVTEDIPDDVTVGLHICRGNFAEGFWDGSLEPLAERIFNELPHDRFLIEWENVDREGGYDPIRFVPKGKILAVGLVSTKTPEVEGEDDVVNRLEQASKHLDMDQLAVCPQCGFASLYGDHLVQATDAQWAKLELLGRVADRVWGAA
jgi:5-methyltetrahydropteroyltriglutamate--homocysteine methyltransferase